MNDYEYDVFVSYRQLPMWDKWTRHWFYDQLSIWLQPKVAQPRIFFDKAATENGQSWPQHLQHAHARSKVLVPVLCRSYFDSQWCRYELTTMIERMRVLRAQGHADIRLVFPVVFDDGKDFDPEIRQLGPVELHGYADPDIRKMTKAYRNCQSWMKEWSESVWQALDAVPAFDSCFETLASERFHRALAITNAAQKTVPRFQLDELT